MYICAVGPPLKMRRGSAVACVPTCHISVTESLCAVEDGFFGDISFLRGILDGGRRTTFRRTLSCVALRPVQEGSVSSPTMDGIRGSYGEGRMEAVTGLLQAVSALESHFVICRSVCPSGDAPDSI